MDAEHLHPSSEYDDCSCREVSTACNDKFESDRPDGNVPTVLARTKRHSFPFCRVSMRKTAISGCRATASRQSHPDLRKGLGATTTIAGKQMLLRGRRFLYLVEAL